MCRYRSKPAPPTIGTRRIRQSVPSTNPGPVILRCAQAKLASLEGCTANIRTVALRGHRFAMSPQGDGSRSATHQRQSLPMSSLSAFPIATRWPAKNPDILQLYSFPTPNGVKVSIALEEAGLPYEAHAINILKNESWTPEFLALNPNGKIPAILDPNGPSGKPLGLFESGAILQYIADKTGKLMPADANARYETIQWLHFQMGG